MSGLARGLGRSLGTRFPWLGGSLDFTGRALRVLFIVAFVLFIGYGLLFVVAEVAKNPGRVLDSPLVTLVVGFLILVVEWLWSLPGYVWLGLLVFYGVFAIASQLRTLNAQISYLIEEVRALKAQQDRSHNDFDDLDDDEL